MPKLPNAGNFDLPALERYHASDIVRTHLDTLNRARVSYIESESSERVKSALRFRTRNFNVELKIGDKVYYQRRTKHWRGPGTVIGMDGLVVIVKHGGSIFGVHKSHMKIAGNFEDFVNGDKISTPEAQTVPNANSRQGKETSEIHFFGDDWSGTDYKPTTEITESEPKPGNLPFSEETVCETRCVEKRSDDSTSQDLLSSKPREKATKDFPKSKSRIKLVSDLFCETAEVCGEGGSIVVSRAGKVGKQKAGKHQCWYNLEFLAPEALAGTTRSIDFSRDVQHWEPTEERDEGEQLSISNVDHVTLFESAEHAGTDSDNFLDEKFAEIQSWKNNDVFDEMPFNESMKPLGTRWVLTVKPDGRRKARLVAKRFQDREVDSLIKDSPTCSKETFRIAVAVFASNNRWNTAKALDVKTAFLPLKRNVYISPPKDMFPNSNFTWKLKKCVYCLADASRYWYDRVLHEFEALGGRRSTFDYALFT